MKSRVLTALVAIPIVLGAVFYTHPIPFLILTVITFAFGAWEFLSLSGKPSKILLALSTVLFCLLAWMWLRFQRGMPDLVVLFSAAALSVFSIYSGFKEEHREKPRSLFLIAEAFGWIGAPLIALILAHGDLSSRGTWYFPSLVLMILLPLWGGDTAGILVGMAMGKHKLAPSISPKKTVEGAIGNLVIAVVVAIAVGPWLRMPTLTACLCGVSAGVLGQVGDLFESWVKRKANLKDSGKVLPGHGGVLDRIDSLLFVAIPTVILMYLK